METLQVAKMVAAHPVMIKLRQRQQAMQRQLQSDYGDNFMISVQEMPNMTLPNGRKSRRMEGVHVWTRPQREEWFNIETRLRNTRRALRNVYTTV